MKFILLRGDAPIGEAYRVHGYSWLVIDHEYSYRFPRMTPLLVPSPCSLVNSTYSRMHTAPNPLALRAPLERTWLLAILYGCLAACLAHPCSPLARALPLRGKCHFPTRYPTRRFAASVGPRGPPFASLTVNGICPAEAGWGASPPKSNASWGSLRRWCSATFLAPPGNRRWTLLINPAAKASPCPARLRLASVSPCY